MANPQKTYFLSPSWDYHPSGPIQLGNLIVSPTTPAEALNGPDCPRPPPSACFPPTTKTGETWSSTDQRAGRYGLWTEFLSSTLVGLGAGVDLAVEHALAASQTFRFESSETREFLPTAEFVMSCLAASPAALAFLSRSRFRKHLYMVTAVKIVRGASAETARARSRGVEVGVTLEGALVGGAPVSLGPELRAEKAGFESGSFEGSSDFVFAFRLRKIVVRRGTAEVVKNAQYTSGAMYDADVKQDGVSFVLDEAACEEASADGEDGKTVVEDGEEVICVKPQQSVL
ncbi:hypothetical protein N658DRAFT_485477 [Parathielavia hyrcaniae]|uniref:Uncharacterized protein n=1 Tax=Parathielavia hyrcaniae TaxID=113614 RepID=A0AAN6Q5D9_9PEZI|nr:hypothetical protein N658DRAFT_485477 [Parathielavia hyrcaniae]